MNEVGNRYSRLLVVSSAGVNKRGLKMWNCLCDCGNASTKRGSSLRNGTAKSCGCLRVDTSRVKATTHGMTGHPILESYKGAKGRCTNQNDRDYSFYGGRGIKFCFVSFDQFRYLLEPTWFEGASLERIDNDGNYEPGNVRWATRREQCLNTRRSVKLSLNGTTKNQSDWAKELGIHVSSLRERIQKWGVERALTTRKKSNC